MGIEVFPAQGHAGFVYSIYLDTVCVSSKVYDCCLNKRIFKYDNCNNSLWKFQYYIIGLKGI